MIRSKLWRTSPVQCNPIPIEAAITSPPDEEVTGESVFPFHSGLNMSRRLPEKRMRISFTLCSRNSKSTSSSNNNGTSTSTSTSTSSSNNNGTSRSSSSRRSIRKLKLMDLPIEMLIEIFLRLPPKALCSIQCVSKTLFNIISGPFSTTLFTRLLTATPATAADHQVPPQLMCVTRLYSFPEPFYSRQVMALQFLKYNATNNSLTKGQHIISFSDILTPEEFWDADRQNTFYNIPFVFGNLICLKHVSDHGRCFLINPYLSGGQVLRLPASKLYTGRGGSTRKMENEWYGMGFDKITNTYKIVRTSRNYRLDGVVWPATEVLVLGGTSGSWQWRGTSGSFQWRRVPAIAPCLTHAWWKSLCAYGDAHWLVEEIEETGHIVSFNFEKEEFYRMPHPTIPSKKKKERHHLISFRGSMAVVDVSSLDSFTTIGMWVLKDFDKKEWAREYYTVKDDGKKQFGGRTRRYSCCEWEHGLFFKEIENIGFWKPDDIGLDPAFCLDLRCDSMKEVTWPRLIDDDLPKPIIPWDTRIFSL